jgi:hypothetical protein
MIGKIILGMTIGVVFVYFTVSGLDENDVAVLYFVLIGLCGWTLSGGLRRIGSISPVVKGVPNAKK